VLRQACNDAAGWPGGLRVHVNISARHLAEDGFSELVTSALAESGLAPDRLELEITESTALFAAEATLYAVSKVTEAGVTLALDDFGTGYSAITALHRLPIHTVKIDRSFVADVVTEPSTAALVQGLLQLGRGMGLQVIAEGIEDLDQAEWLLRHGCAMAQGYAFGRPAPLPSTAELLIDEITEAPGEEMTEETPEELTAALPEITPVGTTVTADLTGELDGLADDGAQDAMPPEDAVGAEQPVDDAAPPPPAAEPPPLPLFPWVPVQRTSGPTGEFPRPSFVEDEAPSVEFEDEPEDDED
jgi:EAL domain-containing protein (putative c-di-GMP-specific phosphodiesterase class I)